MAPRIFGVEVSDGTVTTNHRITVPADSSVITLDTDDAAAHETLVRHSVEFLLEREPADEILDEFDLADISRYFPDYPEAIKARMS